MPWGAIIGGGASLLGGLLGGGAAGSAAKQEQAAGQQAGAVAGGMYGAGMNLLNPYISSGSNATNLLSNYLTNPGALSAAYQASPGYGFELQQGLGAVNNSAAAKGGLVGGNTLQALQSTGQGLANQDYQQFIQNLMGLSGQGLSAAGQGAQLGQDYAATYGQDVTGTANAGAAGTIGGANAWGGALGSLGNGLITNALGSNSGGFDKAIGSGFNFLRRFV